MAAGNNFIPDNTLDNEQRKFQGDFNGHAAVNVWDTLAKFGDSKLLISLGLIDGMEQRGKSAFNEEVDTNITEDLMIGGGQYVFAPTAQIIDITSTSALDTIAGTAAQTVFIRGVDSTYAEISEVVELDGLSVASTLRSYLRVNDFIVITAGTGGFNDGVITAAQTTSTIVMSTIQADPKGGGLNNSFQFIFTVPLGFTIAITALTASTSRMTGSGGIKEGGYFFSVRPFGGVFTPSGFASTRSDGASVSIITPNYPVTFPEKTDLRGRTIAFVNNTATTASMQYTLIENSKFGL